MFPLGLGIVGSAYATAFSPVICMLICLLLPAKYGFPLSWYRIVSPLYCVEFNNARTASHSRLLLSDLNFSSAQASNMPLSAITFDSSLLFSLICQKKISALQKDFSFSKYICGIQLKQHGFCITKLYNLTLSHGIIKKKMKNHGNFKFISVLHIIFAL